jgi:dihydroorotate dehydrogenase
VTSPYRVLFDKVLTRTDPERAHHAAFTAIRTAEPLTRRVLARRSADPSRVDGPAARPVASSRVLGIDFPGVLGLAAGFDKNAQAIDGLAALGFGFVEIGTVTGEPQPGNPKPRLARLPADRAIVNRMGFNNDGAEAVARRLAAREQATVRRAGAATRDGSAGLGGNTRRVGVPLGVNIGKTKVVPEDAAIADYEKSTTLLAPYADYLVVNVSSPNTPGLRDLQAVEKLEPLLVAVRRRADAVTERRVPLLVKIAPDLADDDVDAVADLARAIGLDGIVATNTTIGRSGLVSSPADVEHAGGGGLSGVPLRQRSLDVLRRLRARAGEDLVLVGVGGIATLDDALERLAAGADLLQAYTAFIYEGPRWPAHLNRALGGTA